jgi:hypothetical protein
MAEQRAGNPLAARNLFGRFVASKDRRLAAHHMDGRLFDNPVRNPELDGRHQEAAAMIGPTDTPDGWPPDPFAP